MKAATVDPVDVLMMSPEEAGALASGLDEANAYVLAVGMARLASAGAASEQGYAAMKAAFGAMYFPSVALAAYAAFDWQQSRMDRIRGFHAAVCWAVMGAFGMGKAGACGPVDPRARFFVDHTGIMPDRLDTHFAVVLDEARRSGTLVVKEVTPRLTHDSVAVARGFLAFVHGKNAERVTEADVARVASYLCWTDAEAAADANRNVEAWQARLFAAGVMLGRASPR